MLPELTKQHKVILNKLDNMRKDARNKIRTADIYCFKVFLIKHKNFKEKDVYPRLNQASDYNAKKSIVEIINEIV